MAKIEHSYGESFIKEVRSGLANTIGGTADSLVNGLTETVGSTTETLLQGSRRKLFESLGHAKSAIARIFTNAATLGTYTAAQELFRTGKNVTQNISLATFGAIKSGNRKDVKQGLVDGGKNILHGAYNATLGQVINPILGPKYGTEDHQRGARNNATDWEKRPKFARKNAKINPQNREFKFKNAA